MGLPNQTFADGPPHELPWMVYYHGDHPGSSSVITAGRPNVGRITEGQVVQQYGCKPFGHENYNVDCGWGFGVVIRKYTDKMVLQKKGGGLEYD